MFQKFIKKKGKTIQVWGPNLNPQKKAKKPIKVGDQRKTVTTEPTRFLENPG